MMLSVAETVEIVFCCRALPFGLENRVSESYLRERWVTVWAIP